MSFLSLRRAAAATLVASAALLTACGTAGDSTGPRSASASITPPAPAPQIAIDPAHRMYGLSWKVPFAGPVTVARTIASATGGDLVIPEAGVRLHVPRHAFADSAMTIRMTIHPGPIVFYEFEPHGVTFDQPLTLTQNLAQTNLFKPLGGMVRLLGAYVADTTTIDQASRSAVVTETENTMLNSTGNRLTYEIPHFSGYMISVGRQ